MWPLYLPTRPPLSRGAPIAEPPPIKSLGAAVSTTQGSQESLLDQAFGDDRPEMSSKEDLMDKAFLQGSQETPMALPSFQRRLPLMARHKIDTIPCRDRMHLVGQGREEGETRADRC